MAKSDIISVEDILVGTRSQSTSNDRLGVEKMENDLVHDRLNATYQEEREGSENLDTLASLCIYMTTCSTRAISGVKSSLILNGTPQHGTKTGQRHAAMQGFTSRQIWFRHRWTFLAFRTAYKPERTTCRIVVKHLASDPERNIQWWQGRPSPQDGSMWYRIGNWFLEDCSTSFRSA